MAMLQNDRNRVIKSITKMMYIASVDSVCSRLPNIDSDKITKARMNEQHKKFL